MHATTISSAMGSLEARQIIRRERPGALRHIVFNPNLASRARYENRIQLRLKTGMPLVAVTSRRP